MWRSAKVYSDIILLFLLGANIEKFRVKIRVVKAIIWYFNSTLQPPPHYKSPSDISKKAMQ